jgi:hypothetical protein
MSERFSASNAAKHMACPASANLELAIPNFEFPVVDNIVRASDEGTAAHAVFELLMNYSARDMLHFVTLLQYVADLRSTRRFKVLTEQKVKATWLPSEPDTTVDLVLYTADEMHVLDLKWGRMMVDVFSNVQMTYYAKCFRSLAPKAKGVTIHVLQPRADNMEKYWVSDQEMDEFTEAAIATDLKILAKDLTFGPSDECKFCPAYPHSRSPKGRPLCPATMQLLYPQPLDEDEMLNG